MFCNKSRKSLYIALLLLVLLVAAGSFHYAYQKGKYYETGTRAGQEKTVDLGGGIKLDLVWIPPGNFMMGSTVTPDKIASITGYPTGYYECEHPCHRVHITKGFWMGKYEVTQAQWQAVMGNNPSHFKNGKNGAPSNTQNHPVERVKWKDCHKFLKKLSQKTDKQFCLPTEAEWEYACRAGTSTMFHYGDSLSSTQANFDGRFFYRGVSKGLYLERTTPVGLYQPNSWGLYDMHGNVLEWCHDWYGENYYQNSPRNDPQGPSKSSATELSWVKKGQKGWILRGGSWAHNTLNCRSSDRSRGIPDFGLKFHGFRVVCSSSRIGIYRLYLCIYSFFK